MLPPKYGVDNDRKFRNALERAKETTTDLRIPLGLILADFYKSERPIFKLQSPGQYFDLTKDYKKAKQRRVGFVYPELRSSGFLEESVTSPGSQDAYSDIINKDTLQIGTFVPYAGFLQRGTKKMPARPFFFIGPEAPAFATSEMQGRPSRWLNILNSFVIKKLNREIHIDDALKG